MPLEWFYAPGVKLDMTHHPDGHAISIEDLQQALESAGHTLRPYDIVLIYTGNDRRLGSRDYFHEGIGVSAAATRWLIDQGIRVMGIDAWGWDTPLRAQARTAKAQQRSDIFWSAHFVGREREYCQIERLAGLDQLPATGFRICAFPLKVKSGSAGPARVVAMIESAS
jgi:kynurenine formamidase